MQKCLDAFCLKFHSPNLDLSNLLLFSTVRYSQSTVKGDNLGEDHVVRYNERSTRLWIFQKSPCAIIFSLETWVWGFFCRVQRNLLYRELSDTLGKVYCKCKPKYDIWFGLLINQLRNVFRNVSDLHERHNKFNK